jgi:X-X-X-Leu-X-X-Gly heptad repeat protein
VYSYVALAVVIVGLGVLARIAVSVLGRLVRLGRQAGDLAGRVSDAQQLQVGIADLHARLAELQQGVSRLKA